MDDFVTWLQAQVAEDENAVRAMIGKGPTDGFLMKHRAVQTLIVEADSSTEAARFRLAECEAKRRIIDAVRRGLDGHPGACVNVEGDNREDYNPYDSCALHLKWAKQTLPVLAAQILALPYADRPGYREEWKP